MKGNKDMPRCRREFRLAGGTTTASLSVPGFRAAAVGEAPAGHAGHSARHQPDSSPAGTAAAIQHCPGIHRPTAGFHLLSAWEPVRGAREVRQLTLSRTLSPPRATRFAWAKNVSLQLSSPGHGGGSNVE